ncbi:MAG: TatD family hydrolase, partial [Anaerolineaceae bacterium]|nr:TatD family hydrolase [Anaerolineaceae bacterium]
MEFADTHCHLNFEPLSSSLKEVLDRARQHAVVNILMPAVDLETSRQVIALSEEDSNLFCAIGVHPNSSLSWNKQTLSELRKLTEHPKVKAIGEIGLDYYRNRAPTEIQIQVFRQLLDLAFETGLPVIVHNRSASVDTLPLLWTWRSELVKNAAPQ